MGGILLCPFLTSAGAGANGQGSNRHGKRGENLVIQVPRGTVVRDAETNAIIVDMSTGEDFVIAKGGITSSDVGTKALRVRRANVMGQIRPGIPVWQTRSESKFPNTPYVIFPGNVGEDVTLREAAEILMQP